MKLARIKTLFFLLGFMINIHIFVQLRSQNVYGMTKRRSRVFP